MTQSDFAKLAGVSRQNISALVKKGEIIKEDNGGINPENEANAIYLAGRKDAPRVITNPAPKKIKPEKEVKEIKKRGRPKKSKNETEIIIPIIDTPSSKKEGDPPSLQKQKLLLEVEKLKENVEKARLENAKARAEVCEVDTLLNVVIGYCIALNKSILNMPKSYIDDFEIAMKQGKSKTILNDILTAPISMEIEETIQIIKKEIKKYKDAARRAMIKNEK